MKKLLLFCGILMLCTSCGRLIEKLIPDNDGSSWSVNNGTNQILKLKFPSSSALADDDYREYVIEPEEYVQIDVLAEGNFGEYFKKCADVYGENVSWQILSGDDVVLKTWNYSDWGQPNQRFFKKSSWNYSIEPTGFTYIGFEILPKDIE